MTLRTDPFSTLFDGPADDAEIWRARLALLRAPFADRGNIRPAFVNDLRFGGDPNVNLLESALEDPRLAFIEEWDRKVRHRKLWEFARCDPAYDAAAVEAVARLATERGERIPASVAEFATRKHAGALVMYWQPTNNFLVAPSEWSVQKGPEDWRFLRIIDENQGCCFWYVAWRAGGLDGTQLDPPVFVGDEIDPDLEEVPDFFTRTECTANRWSEFLLDYAAEGARWYDENPDDYEDTARYDRANEP
jgi:hypothetical protein